MSDDFFTSEQVDAQIERISRGDASEEARMLLDVRRAYEGQASANREALERVLGQLLQEEARMNRRTPSKLVSLQERRRSMERSISDHTSRRSLWQRLGMAVAVLFVLVLVGSTALVISMEQRQKGNTNQHPMTKPTTKTSPVVQQSNLYVSYGTTLKKLDSKDGSVLWMYTASSRIDLAVTVANGMVYATAQDGTLYALNASNGHEIWHLKGKKLAEVAVAGHTLYTMNYIDGILYALDASHGQVLWQRQLPAYLSWLTVVDDILYVTNTLEQPNAPLVSNLYALNASDGSSLWHVTVTNQFFNAPVIVQGVLYIDSTLDDKGANPPDRHGYVYAFKAKTGKSLWQTARIQAYLGLPPVVANGMVYVGLNELGTADPAVYAFRASDGSFVWKQATKHSADSCLLATYSAVYVAEPTLDSGVETPLVALDAHKGSLQWSHMLVNYFGFGPHGCAFYNDRIYVATNDGFIHVLRAEDGKEAGRYPLPEMRFWFVLNLIVAP